MPELNADVPPWTCLLRAEFLYDQDPARAGSFVPVTVFGVASVQGRALGFHVLTESGAMVWRLPIHALVHRPDAPPRQLDDLQLWDCFSYFVTVTEFSHLVGRICTATLKDRSRVDGRYLFTVDWYGTSYAEGAGDLGHKCAHVLELAEGNYAALPNNRIWPWYEPAFGAGGDPTAAPPDFKTNTREWRCEGREKWRTGGGMFYDTEPVEPVEPVAGVARPDEMKSSIGQPSALAT